ncbi:hypothetical protein [Anaeromicropila herbilytica]|uniref:Uncharacterized protein n=1 Tax=Anaeromicropila herbilytica TaxID=2785025 RepID=A0A7R7EIR3_9FIRM|nr:hypothetical protein [Anaeromicropila herbilytica]BCN29444.1 hypothetical protein bsdtb5_07390 [Anaeromicropila herbilytica]
MIEYYKSLPDYMPIDELEKLFRRFLINVKTTNFRIEESLEALLELADRQWYTYELLSEDLKAEIEEWLLSIIDFESDEIIEYLTLIVGRLGLSKLYATMKGSLTGNLKKEVRQEIEEIVEEIDGHVENPYYGM